MNTSIHPSVHEMWSEFTQKNIEYKSNKTPPSYYFCDNEKDANECAGLVVKGIKRATSASLWWYKKTGEALPRAGDIYIITDWNGVAQAIIRVSKVEQVRYNEITPTYAAIEGEGDKSLAYWKEVHWSFFSREMQSHGEEPTEDMIIVCEEFEMIWK